MPKMMRKRQHKVDLPPTMNKRWEVTWSKAEPQRKSTSIANRIVYCWLVASMPGSQGGMILAALQCHSLEEKCNRQDPKEKLPLQDSARVGGTGHICPLLSGRLVWCIASHRCRIMIAGRGKGNLCSQIWWLLEGGISHGQT
jgi:hypothetical protein